MVHGGWDSWEDRGLLSQSPSHVTHLSAGRGFTRRERKAEHRHRGQGLESCTWRPAQYSPISILKPVKGWSGVRHAGPHPAGSGAEGQQFSGNWETEGHTLCVFKLVPRVLGQTRWLSTRDIYRKNVERMVGGLQLPTATFPSDYHLKNFLCTRRENSGVGM